MNGKKSLGSVRLDWKIILKGMLNVKENMASVST
jgi:hypothetical protein